MLTPRPDTMHDPLKSGLSAYSSNVNSQFGEDGIVREVLRILPVRDQWCVEFGAWDGRHLSNTCRLIEEDSYSAVLIEGDARKFAELEANFASYPGVISFCRYVGFENDRLDNILGETSIPKDFDFLSIDIDGCDYHIWDSLKNYEPKVVCIEFNPTVPNGLEFVQTRDFSVAQGASLDSLVALGRTKGYELVSTTRNNGIFVRSEFYPLFGIANNSVELLRKDTLWVSQVFVSYAGELLIAGANVNPWNGIQLDRMVRQLPKPLRTFPGNMGFLRRKSLGLWKKIFGLAAPH
jgi:hypothetical protein